MLLQPETEGYIMKLLIMSILTLMLGASVMAQSIHYGSIPYPTASAEQAIYEIDVDENADMLVADGSNSRALHGTTYLNLPNNDGPIVNFPYWAPTSQSAGLNYGAKKVGAVLFSYGVSEEFNYAVFGELFEESSYPVTITSVPPLLEGTFTYDTVPLQISATQGTPSFITVTDSASGNFNWDLDPDGVARIIVGAHVIEITPDWTLNTITINRYVGHGAYSTAV